MQILDVALASRERLRDCEKTGRNGRAKEKKRVDTWDKWITIAMIAMKRAERKASASRYKKR
jgi:hypothetical protein